MRSYNTMFLSDNDTMIARAGVTEEERHQEGRIMLNIGTDNSAVSIFMTIKQAGQAADLLNQAVMDYAAKAAPDAFSETTPSYLKEESE